MGIVKVQNEIYNIGDIEEEIYLVVIADSLHTSLMLSNCCTIMLDKIR